MCTEVGSPVVNPFRSPDFKNREYLIFTGLFIVFYKQKPFNHGVTMCDCICMKLNLSIYHTTPYLPCLFIDTLGILPITKIKIQNFVLCYSGPTHS